MDRRARRFYRTNHYSRAVPIDYDTLLRTVLHHRESVRERFRMPSACFRNGRTLSKQFNIEQI